tara:strand:- start:90 stop:308 length:219 start_codon:yes stop_codon:yes gene_type:complete
VDGDAASYLRVDIGYTNLLWVVLHASTTDLLMFSGFGLRVNYFEYFLPLPRVSLNDAKTSLLDSDVDSMFAG